MPAPRSCTPASVIFQPSMQLLEDYSFLGKEDLMWPSNNAAASAPALRAGVMPPSPKHCLFHLPQPPASLSSDRWLCSLQGCTAREGSISPSSPVGSCLHPCTWSQPARAGLGEVLRSTSMGTEQLLAQMLAAELLFLSSQAQEQE